MVNGWDGSMEIPVSGAGKRNKMIRAAPLKNYLF